MLVSTWEEVHRSERASVGSLNPGRALPSSGGCCSDRPGHSACTDRRAPALSSVAPPSRSCCDEPYNSRVAGSDTAPLATAAARTWSARVTYSTSAYLASGDLLTRQRDALIASAVAAAASPALLGALQRLQVVTTLPEVADDTQARVRDWRIDAP